MPAADAQRLKQIADRIKAAQRRGAPQKEIDTLVTQLNSERDNIFKKHGKTNQVVGQHTDPSGAVIYEFGDTTRSGTTGKETTPTGFEAKIDHFQNEIRQGLTRHQQYVQSLTAHANLGTERANQVEKAQLQIFEFNAQTNLMELIRDDEEAASKYRFDKQSIETNLKNLKTNYEAAVANINKAFSRGVEAVNHQLDKNVATLNHNLDLTQQAIDHGLGKAKSSIKTRLTNIQTDLRDQTATTLSTYRRQANIAQGQFDRQSSALGASSSSASRGEVVDPFDPMFLARRNLDTSLGRTAAEADRAIDLAEADADFAHQQAQSRHQFGVEQAQSAAEFDIGVLAGQRDDRLEASGLAYGQQQEGLTQQGQYLDETYAQQRQRFGDRMTQNAIRTAYGRDEIGARYRRNREDIQIDTLTGIHDDRLRLRDAEFEGYLDRGWSWNKATEAVAGHDEAIASYKRQLENLYKRGAPTPAGDRSYDTRPLLVDEMGPRQPFDTHQRRR